MHEFVTGLAKKERKKRDKYKFVSKKDSKNSLTKKLQNSA